MSKYVVTLCMVLGLAIAAQAAPLAVVNGGFDGAAQGYGAWAYNGMALTTGWDVVACVGGSGVSAISIEHDYLAPGDIGYVSSGTLYPAARAVQTLADTFQMGYTYTLQVDMYSPTIYENDQFRADLRVGTWDGAVALRLDQVSNPEVYATQDTWHTISGSVTITDPAMVGQAIVITVGDTHGLYGNGNGVHAFDNVSVDMVPEPMTMTLLAFGSLAMLKRRK